jgi:murein DD-endopeptidase MepM/ murein hydrolase activator NlpD
VDFAYYHDHDRDSILGETVQSVLGGRVAMALKDRFPYGNAVIVETVVETLLPGMAQIVGIEAGQSLYLLYAHLGTAPGVQLGEELEPCRRLGEAGQSGNAGAPHLHLEARVGPAGEAFESMAFYQLPLTPEEMDSYLRWRIGGEFRHFDPMTLIRDGW